MLTLSSSGAISRIKNKTHYFSVYITQLNIHSFAIVLRTDVKNSARKPETPDFSS